MAFGLNDMNKYMVKNRIKKALWILRYIKKFIEYVYSNFIKIGKSSNYGNFSENTLIQVPFRAANIKNVFLYDCMIRHHFCLINSTGRFIVKDYSVIAPFCTVITGNHVRTVAVSCLVSSVCHVNDKEADIIVEEDVWIGAHCTLLAGAHIGRGAIVGACSLVNKDVKPYSVVVGSPARVIATVFTIDQIIEHEKLLYPENLRFKREYLEDLFENYYKGLKSIGVDNISNEDLDYIEHVKKSRKLD